MTSYNKYYETWIRGNDTIPATYGNVSLYTTGKADLNKITTTNLAINKNNTANALDVSGNVVVNGSITLNGQAITGGVNYVDLTTDQNNIFGDKTFTGNQVIFTPSVDNTYGNGTIFDKTGFNSIGHKIDYFLQVEPYNTENYFKITTISGANTTEYLKISSDAANNAVGLFKGITTFDGDILRTADPPTNNSLTRKSYVDNALTNSLTNYYTKSQVDTSFNNYYTKSQVDNTLTNYYTKTQSDTNYYTKTQVDTNYYTKTYTDASFVGLGNAQTITGVKTFSQPTEFLTLPNKFFTDFSLNGFTIPTARTLLIPTSATGITTYSNWRFYSQTAGYNSVYWWLSSRTLEFYGDVPQLAPPIGGSGTEYGLMCYTQTQSSQFYIERVVNLPAGYYNMYWYSWWGYTGGSGGRATATITISIQNSTTTFAYNDADTASGWKIRNLKFYTSGATWIRWTPSDTITQQFPWTIANFYMYGYGVQKFVAGSTEAVIGGELSVLNNPTLNGTCNIAGTLSMTGIPSFLTASNLGLNNLAINSNFGSNTSNWNNSSNVCIGLSSGLNATTWNNTTLVGINSQNLGGGVGTALKNSVFVGSFLQGGGEKMLAIGYYQQHKYDPTIGENVSIGFFQGATTTSAYTGCYRRSICIGSYNFIQGNPFNYLNGAVSSIAIGSYALQNYGDVGCIAIGESALNSLIGTNGLSSVVGGASYITRYNIALGYQAGMGTGLGLANNCMFIGTNSDYLVNDISYSVAIGNGAKVGASYAYAIGTGVQNSVANSIRLGRSADLVQIDGTLSVSGAVSLGSGLTCRNINSQGYSVDVGPLNVRGNTWDLLASINNGNNEPRFKFYDEGGGRPRPVIQTGSGSGYGFEAPYGLWLNSTKTAGDHRGTIYIIGNYGVFVGPDEASAFNILTKFSNIDASLNNVVSLTEDETIYGTKTFSDIPLCSQSATISTHLTNKDYVDGAITNLSSVYAGLSANNTFEGQNTFDASSNFYGSVNVLNTEFNFIDNSNTTRFSIKDYQTDFSNNTIYLKGGSRIRKEGMYLSHFEGPNHSTNVSITKPFNSVYGVSQTTSPWTITLPTILQEDLGSSIKFRKIASTGTANISCIGNGTQKVYGKDSVSGSTSAVAIITTSVYYVEVIALLESSGGTNYAWFVC